MNFYHFGCQDRAGHYLFAASGSLKRDYYDIPVAKLDGGLCPKADPWGKPGQVQGQALLHHISGWTIVSFWDRSIDTRPGSNSSFLAEAADLTFDQMMQLANRHFPKVVGRFKFPIVLCEERPS